MSYIDSHTLLSDAQAITGDASSTNLYDTGATPDVGPGTPLRLLCSIDAAFDALTHLDIRLQTDDNSSFTSPKNLFSTSVALAGLTLGAQIDLPAITGGCERFIRANYDVVGSNPTVGNITLGVVLDVHRNVPTTDFS